MSEREKLCEAVDVFAEAMKKRLLEKHDEGFEGWNNKENSRNIQKRLHICVAESSFESPGDIQCFTREYVDIANFAMMLYRKGKGIK